MYAKYTELAENNNREELMAEYEKLMTKVVDEDTENVIKLDDIKENKFNNKNYKNNKK